MTATNQPIATTKPAVDQTTITRSWKPIGSDETVEMSVASVLRDFARPTKNGAMPTPAQAKSFLMLCLHRQLNPWEGDAFLVGYDGRNGSEFSLITAHQAFGKRAETNPNFDGMESGVIVQNKEGDIIDREGDFVHPGDVVLGGWAKVWMRGRKLPTVRRLNLSSRQKDTHIWRSDAAGMIVKCAESDALRSTFPTKLGGLYMDRDERPDAVYEVEASATIEPIKQLGGAEKLAKKLQAKKETAPNATTENPQPDHVIEDSKNTLATKEQIDVCNRVMHEKQITAEQLGKILAAAGARNLSVATAEQADAVYKMLDATPADDHE